jgi:hypothetical protein
MCSWSRRWKRRRADLGERRPVLVRVRWEATRRSLTSSLSISPVTALWLRAGQVSWRVAGRASVVEDGSLVGGGPHETENDGVKGRVGCAQIVEGKVILSVGENFGEVKRVGGSVADGNNRARSELGRRE